ncbi:MAG TPA: YdbH domain-containing protein [Thermohalobaculum sp.]|nr:YdbH domain-containing protein [Thermohalobaculum sp.]
MGKLRKALLGFGLVLGVAVPAGILWREALVEAAARQLLAARGIDGARLEVVEVGAAGIVIEDIRLGDGLPGARRVRLDYDARELLSGRLRTLRIEGVRYDAPADWGAVLAPLGALGPGEGGAWLTLPRVEIEDAVIALAAPAGGSIAIDGALDLSGERPGAAIGIGLELGHASAAFTIASPALGEGGTVEISGGGEAGLSGMALPGRPGLSATGGHARFSLAGTARLPALGGGREAMWGALHAGLQVGEAFALAGELSLAGVTGPAGPGTLSADIGWALRGGDGGLQLTLPRPARGAVTGLSADLLAALGLAAADGTAPDLSVELATAEPLVAWVSQAPGGVAEIAADLALALGDARASAGGTVTVRHDAAWRLTAPVSTVLDLAASGLPLAGAGTAAWLRSAEWSVAGSASLDRGLVLEGPLVAEARDLELAGLGAGAVTAEGVLRLAGHPGRWAVGAAPGMQAVVEAAVLLGRIEAPGPLRLTLESLDFAAGGGAPRLDLRARLDPASGALRRDNGEPVAFADAAGRIAIGATLGDRIEGEIRLEDGRVTLPGYATGLTALTGHVPLAGSDDPAGAALSGEVRDTGRAVRFTPVGFALEGQRTRDALTLSGTAEARGGAVRLPLEVTADLAAATGRMRFLPSRIRFRRGGLQPAALMPGFAELRDVAGTVRVGGEVTLDAQGSVRSSASLDIEDLAARAGELEVVGLAGRLRLGSLDPPATAGPQELTASQVIAGVPLEGTRLRFTLLPRRHGMAVQIHEATGGLAGGTVALGEARWDSTAETSAFEVRVRDVPIGRLLSDWQIEGISGTGRLSGVIPVSLGPAGIGIAGGRLDAAGPGVIRVDWGSARERLVNSGEQVALTVRALEDFHYETLSIGVDQPVGGALSLAVGLDGASPEVLDGYPFRFNITLSGALAPILDAVREGRRIGAGLLSGGLGAGQ